MIKRLFRLLFFLAGLLAGLLVLLLVMLAFLRIPIDLTAGKPYLESFAASALGREVAIDGRITLTTSIEPALLIQDIRLGNPEDFVQEEFVSVESAHMQIRLLPLLQRKMHLATINGRGIHVQLLENEAGRNNWSAPVTGEDSPAAGKDRQRVPLRENLLPDTLVIDQLVFEDISVSLKTAEMNDFVRLAIHRCNGSVQPGKPTFLDMHGTWQTHRFTADILVGSLQELLEQDRSWMEINMEIAETRFNLTGTVDLVTVLDSLNLKTGIRGARLDSLNQLLDVDLPPLQNYEASADMTLRQKVFTLNKMQVRVGESLLEGQMVVDGRGERPDADITLTAPLIQFNDFDPGRDLAENAPVPEQGVNKSESGEREQKEQAAARESGGEDRYAELFGQDFFKQFDASLAVDLEAVMSGRDSLGGGVLQASLQEGRLSVDPLQLDIPGGSLFMALSFAPGDETADASLRVTAENYDFGIAARRAKPDTDMGGTLDLDINLLSSGGNLDEILANGNGYVDFSARPVNLNSGIMDLWVVNLVAAILFRSNKEGSPVNCLISRWSMEDGFLTPDAFAVDTGTMRICGSGNINLQENTIDLRIAPTPKSKQFFSLATPFSIKGKITDINMGVAPGGIIGTSVRFVLSPVTVPLSWFLAQKIPGDGSDICTMKLGADDRPEKKPPGCR